MSQLILVVLALVVFMFAGWLRARYRIREPVEQIIKPRTYFLALYWLLIVGSYTLGLVFVVAGFLRDFGNPFPNREFLYTADGIFFIVLGSLFHIARAWLNIYTTESSVYVLGASIPKESVESVNEDFLSVYVYSDSRKLSNLWTGSYALPKFMWPVSMSFLEAQVVESKAGVTQ